MSPIARPDGPRAELKALARSRGRDPDGIVREAAGEHIRVRRTHRLRLRMTRAAREQGPWSDGDVSRRIPQCIFVKIAAGVDGPDERG